jgi:hypothetical protein
MSAVTGYGLDDRGLTSSRLTPRPDLPQPTGSSRVKQRELEVGHSGPSSAEVKNAWN